MEEGSGKGLRAGVCTVGFEFALILARYRPRAWWLCSKRQFARLPEAQRLASEVQLQVQCVLMNWKSCCSQVAKEQDPDQGSAEASDRRGAKD